jgi:hypothetical protein
MMLALSKYQISWLFHGHVEGDRVDAALETLAASPSGSVWELENRPQIGPRPVGPVAKLQPSPEGLGHRFRTSSERRRRGTRNVGSAAPPALDNLGDPSPSPSPDFLWNLVVLATSCAFPY